MGLSPRHFVILRALIEDFVAENKPIGSKTLCEKHSIGLSSATIRNVFRDLEEAGFINSVHQSGGRIPTERGYRFYVDQLITLYELTIREKQKIQEEFLKNQLKLEQILLATTRVLSSISESAGVVLAPKKTFDTVKHIHFIHITGEEILMIIVTRSGDVMTQNLFIEDNISQESLHQIARFLNEHIIGFEVDTVFKEIIPDLKMMRGAPEEFHSMADKLISSYIDRELEEELYIDGLKNLCNNFKDEDIIQMESVFQLLDNKELLKKVFSQYIKSDGVTTLIGEREDETMSGVSIVATNYKMGEKKIGSLGIIGPQRMNYKRTLPLVQFTSTLVSEMLTKISR